jgi:hypothetical protein
VPLWNAAHGLRTAAALTWAGPRVGESCRATARSWLPGWRRSGSLPHPGQVPGRLPPGGGCAGSWIAIALDLPPLWVI